MPASLLDDVPIALPPALAALYRAAWPSADLLADSVHPAPSERVLVLGCAADPLCLALARRVPAGVCLVADDDAAALAELARLAAGASLTSVRTADPAELAAHENALFDRALANTLYHPSRRATAHLLGLAHALLAPGAALHLAGARNRGILSAAEDLRALFGNAATDALRKGHRVITALRGTEPPHPDDRALAAPPAAPAEPVSVHGDTLWLLPDPALFAGGRLDPATALLAAALEVRADDVIADLGSGSGVLGMVAARLAPYGHAYLLDASSAATRVASANAQRNAIANVTALAGDAIALLREHVIQPTLIVTNPPFHVGQLQTNQIALHFITGAAAALAPGGRFYLVANRFLTYEADLRAHFASVREVAGDARYKVLLAETV